jgi:protocatechuate 3,4-dioxygenase beta subunit
MRAGVWLGAGLLLSCSLLSAQNAKPAKKPAVGVTFRIAGTVVNSVTSRPLAHAQVTVTNTADPKDTQSITSTDDGRFQFQVGSGKYSLQGDKSGFIAFNYDQHENFWTGIVTGGAFDTENLVLRLPPAATITGTVTDDNGEPVRDAKVGLLLEDHSIGISRLQVSFVGGSTDDLGSFEFHPLKPGTYVVVVEAQPWYAVHPLTSPAVAATYQVDKTLDVAFPMTFYRDGTEPENATPIVVEPGARAQADIHMNAAAALHLFFHGNSVAAKGVNPVFLVKPAFSDGQNEPLTNAVEEVSPGTYEITGVPAGNYTVHSRGPGDGIPRAPSEVFVNTDGQELPTAGGEATSTVKAKVQVRGSAKLPPELTMLLQNSKGWMKSRAEVEEQGEVSFHAVAPGDYDVVAGSRTKQYSVARITSGAEAVPGHRLTVPAGVSLNLSILLVGGAVTVEGFAQRSGKPGPGAMVVLVPSDPEASLDLFRRDQSDQDGSFAFREVVPGRYTVVAIENGWDLDWAKPEVLEPYLRRGQKIVVGETAKGSLDLPSPVEVQAKQESLSPAE